MEAIHYPKSDDLRDLLRFAAEDGLIWLGEHRMVLLHAGALSELRRELICSVGQEQARRILTRMGFASGMRDAELARRTRSLDRLADAFVVGRCLPHRAATAHARRLRARGARSSRDQP